MNSFYCHRTNTIQLLWAKQYSISLTTTPHMNSQCRLIIVSISQWTNIYDSTCVVCLFKAPVNWCHQLCLLVSFSYKLIVLLLCHATLIEAMRLHIVICLILSSWKFASNEFHFRHKFRVSDDKFLQLSDLKAFQYSQWITIKNVLLCVFISEIEDIKQYIFICMT